MTFVIYLLGIANTIKGVCGAVAGVILLVSLIVAIVIAIDASDHNIEPDWEKFLPFAKKGFCAFLVLLTLAVFLPGQKTIAAMYVVPKIMNNERLQNLTDGSLSVLEGYIQGWAAEMAPPSAASPEQDKDVE